MSFRFLFLADCQLGCYASFSGLTVSQVAQYATRGMRVESVPRVEGFAWDAERYRRAVEDAARLRPAFVAVGGDMVDDLARPEQYDELMRITGRLTHDVPVRWVPGNHDVAFDALRPTPESLALYRRRFGPDRYRFRHEDVHFLVVNTTLMTAPDALPDEVEQQFAFLEEGLAAAEAEGGGPIVVLAHHPFFLGSPSEPDSYWTVPGPARERSLELFHRHGVRLVLAGHWHRNAEARDGDLEMVVSGPVGYPLGDDPSGYRVVEVSGGEIRHSYHSLDGAASRLPRPGA